DDQPHGDRLHAPGGQAAPHFVPEQRADFVTDQPVQHAARLLRINQIVVDLNGLLESFLNGRFGDLVEEDAIDLTLLFAAPADFFGDVAADGFAFTVGVGGDVNRLGVFGGFLQLSDDLFLARHDFVSRLEVVFDVHAEAFFREVLDVTDRGENFVIPAQIFVDRFRLRRRFDDNERFSHDLFQNSCPAPAGRADCDQISAK